MSDTWPLGPAEPPPHPVSTGRPGAKEDGLVRRGVGAAVLALENLFGGPARTRVIVLLAGVLALNSADTATVGAAAGPLIKGLHITNFDVGLLVAVTAVVVAVFSVPFGVLVDRTHRVVLLALTVAGWGVVMLVSASVSDFGQLLIARLVLGGLTAASGPGVASLVGDYFPPDERGKIYGYVLAGELLGAGAGFVVSGDAADISWRLAFVILAIPTVPLAWALFRLPEPARGGSSQLEPGAHAVRGRKEAAPPRVRYKGRETPTWAESEAGPEQAATGDGQVRWFRVERSTSESADPEVTQPAPSAPGATDAQELARRRGVRPDPALVLTSDPRRMGILATMRYVLAVRTNRILILSSACAYFFLTGVETFGIEFVKHQYNVSPLLASFLMLIVGGGAVVGVLLGGRIGDALVRRGRLNGRVLVAAIAALATTLFFIPALVTTSIFAALPYIAVAGMVLTAQNPPIDAARLDIMPPLLWGRAEGVRSFLRTGVQALAPLAFGGLIDVIGGASGYKWTFAIMLVPFLASGLILLRALRSYPKDVATAAASAENAPPATVTSPAPTAH